MSRVSRQSFLAAFLLLTVGCLFAQTQQTSTNDTGAPPAATGLDVQTQMSENPPVSGLDEPKFEPGFGTRSYLAPKIEASENLDTNATSIPGRNNVTDTTRLLGSLDLQKLWKQHPLDLDYIGGVDWYSAGGGHVYQLQSLEATQRFLWRTGQLAVRDSLSYLPEGTFGFASFGGAGGAFGGGGLEAGGIPGGSEVGIFGNGQYGSLSTQPRLTNMGIVDITQYVSPRSEVVLTGAFGLTDFTNNPSGPTCSTVANCYFNSQQAIGELAYNYQISRRNQLALVYAYEELHFPTAFAGSLNVNLVQLLFAHRITGKLDFILGGGPELVRRTQSEEELLGQVPLGLPCINPTQLTPCVIIRSRFITGSARMSLRYRMTPRTALQLGYLRYISPGSGFFGGANTDVVRFSVNHSLERHWTLMMDSGYARNSRLLAVTAGAAGGASVYHYWYLGGGVHRQLGRHWGAFGSYQYDQFKFGDTGCTGTGSNCGLGYGRNILLVGVHWTPQPIRLD